MLPNGGAGSLAHRRAEHPNRGRTKKETESRKAAGKHAFGVCGERFHELILIALRIY
jgi:hypothetical protein